MNNKGQFDFEFNPLALGAGIVTGIIANVVMANSSIGIFWKILGFVGGMVIGYFMFDRIMNN